MPDMTTPDTTKQARISAEAHTKLMALAAQLDGTADDALRHLLGLSTIRVAVDDVQRRRWIAAAEAVGVTVDEFVRRHVETGLQLGKSAATIDQIFYRVDALCRQAGLRPDPVNPKSSARRALSPVSRPEE